MKTLAYLGKTFGTALLVAILAVLLIGMQQGVVVSPNNVKSPKTLIGTASAAGGAPAWLVQNPETANYSTVSGNYSTTTVAETETIYTISSSTSVTHTLLSSGLPAANSCELVSNSQASVPYDLLLSTNGLTLDGTAYTNYAIGPGESMEICVNSAGTNYVHGRGNGPTDMIVANQNGFWVGGDGLGSIYFIGGVNTFTPATNTVYVYGFHLSNHAKVSNVSYRIGTNATENCDFGIYTSNGANSALLFHTGATSVSAGVAVKTAMAAAGYLAPGDYLAATACNAGTAVLSSAASATAAQAIWNASGALSWGTAANAYSSGLPATTGAISNVDANAIIEVFTP